MFAYILLSVCGDLVGRDVSWKEHVLFQYHLRAPCAVITGFESNFQCILESVLFCVRICARIPVTRS